MYLHIKSLQVTLSGLQLALPSLGIKKNDWVSVQAPSGFGKTTLLRALAGLVPAQGEIFLEQKRIDLLPVHLRNFGFVFQDHLLFSHLNAVENVMVGLKLRQNSHEKSLQAAKSCMEALGLGARIHAPIQELSGGERQRVALLRALIWKPKLLLLDEPFKGIDEANQKVMNEFLRQFVAEHGIPVICVSHHHDGKQSWATVEWIGENLDGTRTFNRK